MGGGYSDLNIYFRSLTEDYTGKGYKVNRKQENYKGCIDFEVFTHTIQINTPADGLSHNVQLYEGYDNDHKGDYVFGYYYPNNKNEVIENVSIYYSVLAPNNPLVVSIKTKGNQIYNCLPGDLKKARWNYASNITEYTCGSKLSKDLFIKEFNKVSRNQKICFRIGKGTQEVSGYRQVLGKEYYRFIYRPGGNNSILGCNHLFSLDTVNLKEPNETKKLNEYFLSQLDGKLYDGIMVYYEHSNLKYEYGKEKALLIEFIESSKVKVQLKKKDKEGCLWSIENVPYKDDTQLNQVLKEIKQEKQFATIILDNKVTYPGVDKVSQESKKAINRYKYEFQKAEDPVILFERKEKNIINGATLKAKIVDVYYLKQNGANDDKEPFLIVIDQNGNGDNDKIGYHFDCNYGFKNWQTFKFFDRVTTKTLEKGPLIKKLEEKVEKIDNSGSCIDNLELLRWYAYKILIDEEPPPGEVKKKEEKHRPTVITPKTEKPLPINWIIGGSVGGGVFVISSAALYGVYWYNTTIKLLT